MPKSQDEDEEIVNPNPFEDENDDDDDNGGRQAPTVEQKLATTIEQKKKYKNLAIDPETGKPYKKLLEEARASGSQTSAKVDEVAGQVTDMQLKSAHSLDDTDLMVLKGLASGAGKSAAEILNDKESDAFKAFETYKAGKSAKVNEANAIPEPSTRVPVVDDKSFSELDQPTQQKHYAGTIDTLVNKARSGTRKNLT